MNLHFIQPGLQTSIQDGGRPGMLRWGVPRGGAADTFAMALANLLLTNAPTHPCIEVALTGPEIEFSGDLSIAITGAHFDLRHNGDLVPNNVVLQMKAGDRLQFGVLHSGARAYIALAAEMELPTVLDSHATHLVSAFGGYCGRAIRAGDRITLQRCRREPKRELPPGYRLNYRARPLLRVVPGCEVRYFPAAAINAFQRGDFRVSSQSDRMGIRLTGEPLSSKDVCQVISSGLCPGTVQVPPNGLPIISFVEGQTIGGYPRIAHIISADLHRLGQLQANSPLNFEMVDLGSAHKVLQKKSQLLVRLKDLLQRRR
ncbi:biotin-dependent carboxyltransferase family protein [Microbulbifer pacificus]|uniref:5-oxoprolinase subunit C family protein n=1 Tax=Microbulbifer pacificus TaxID=407164 RepID=UPI001319F148|nr:biotin-dependent carboxyltransferase family protein [Microbulbifer pacificus]